MKQQPFAKSLHKNMTDAERLLWLRLRAHRLDGRKFRRQQPLGPYIVDFVHFAARVIVEADGGQHNESAKDEVRDAWLQREGFKVLRFWNDQILNSTDDVLEVIWAAVAGSESPLSPNPSPANPSPARGEGTLHP